MYDLQLQSFCYCVTELTWPVDLDFSFEGGIEETHPLSAGQYTTSLRTSVDDLLCAVDCTKN